MMTTISPKFGLLNPQQQERLLEGRTYAYTGKMHLSSPENLLLQQVQKDEYLPVAPVAAPLLDEPDTVALCEALNAQANSAKKDGVLMAPDRWKRQFLTVADHVRELLSTAPFQVTDTVVNALDNLYTKASLYPRR